MKTKLFLFFFIIIFLSSFKWFEKTDLIIKFKKHSKCINIEKSEANNWDSLIRHIIYKDTLPNMIAFFYIDALGEGSKGCVVYKRNKNYEGKLFELDGIKVIEHVIKKGKIKSAKDILEGVFQEPEDYLSNFFPDKKKYLSHDNTLFLFLRKNSKILFDEKFMRSSFVGTKNKKSMELVRELGSLL